MCKIDPKTKASRWYSQTLKLELIMLKLNLKSVIHEEIVIEWKIFDIKNLKVYI